MVEAAQIFILGHGVSWSKKKETPLRHKLLTTLLRDVSRSFYLTLRVLPHQVRTPIGLAYLLARASDTIADTTIVPWEHRKIALAQLRNRILGCQTELELSAIAQHQGMPEERRLLEHIDQALEILNSQSDQDRSLIRKVLDTITCGQEFDLEHFGDSSGSTIHALPTWDALDDYTYQVAGCVGEFWTETCLNHLPNAPKDRRDELLQLGVRFGKGLQLVNILRDLPADLRSGRCYLPTSELSQHGLKPIDLLSPENSVRFSGYYGTLIDRAEAHLQAGWIYTNHLPRSWVRVRLACAWPILIGLATLEKLRHTNILDARQKVKISRCEVRKIIAKTVLLYPFPSRWRSLGGLAKSR